MFVMFGLEYEMHTGIEGPQLYWHAFPKIESIHYS